jgi:hypothetical protein
MTSESPVGDRIESVGEGSRFADVKRLETEAIVSRQRFPVRASELERESARIVLDLAPYPGDSEINVNIRVYYQALFSRELEAMAAEYRRHRTESDPENPDWLIEGDVWTANVVSDHSILSRQFYFAQELAIGRQVVVADLAQDLVVSITRDPRPNCPLHRDLLVPREADGQAVWKCESNHWQCRFGTYAASRALWEGRS